MLQNSSKSQKGAGGNQPHTHPPNKGFMLLVYSSVKIEIFKLKLISTKSLGQKITLKTQPDYISSLL